jgi:hypothetical protein
MNDCDTKRYKHCPLKDVETRDGFVYNIVENRFEIGESEE